MKYLIPAIFGLFVISAAIPVAAATSDLDGDGVLDHEDPEVVVVTDQSLPAGEYVFHDLVVSSSSVLQLNGDPSASLSFKGVKLVADNITIEEGSAVSADGAGYTSLVDSPGAPEGNGGFGYGGKGGDWHYRTSSGFGGETYGSAFRPTNLGSGRESKAGGGGAIWLSVSGTLENNGSVSANGARNRASGGSIYAQVDTLTGAGAFVANGAPCAGWPYSGAGGGGRIAVYYAESSFTGSTDVLRGGATTASTNCKGERSGHDGTVAFVDTRNDDLYLPNRFVFQERGISYEFNHIFLSDNARVSSEPGVSVVAHAVTLDDGSSFVTEGMHVLLTEELIVENGSVFTSAEGLGLALTSLVVRNGGNAQLGRGETLLVDSIVLESEALITAEPMQTLHLAAEDVVIDETSAISVNGAGYPPRQGPGYNDTGAGASHGGRGERGTPEPVYGTATAPVDFGSGGSSEAYGGGSLRMVVSGTLENNGVISADATRYRNGASGGSVYVTTEALTGSGSFTALGGDTRGYTANIGAGGGGRIAIYYADSAFTGTTSAEGGNRYVGGPIQRTYYAQDGTVVFEEKQPEGLSSILFLPGIQASRLYSDEGGSEERLWEPGGNGDVERLAMTEEGESIEHVYAKEVVDEVLGVAAGKNIYKGFLEFLNELDDPSGGPLVNTFPYDWRRSVFDIVENGTPQKDGSTIRPTSTIAHLADLSPTGKVTLIAHSNGGLLAKAIMLELEKEGKADLIDKIIFIGTPHLGTPKGTAALLHGFGQGADIFNFPIVTPDVVREVVRNMPSAYGLLPSEEYVGLVDEPMITFDDSDTTKLFRDHYGFAVTNMEEYTNFLNGAEGRDEPGDVLDEPAIAHDVMLAEALTAHKEVLDAWQAPEGVRAFNVVGTGLPTPERIHYREVIERECLQPFLCPKIPMLRPEVYLTRYGDKTVVSRATEEQIGKDIYFDIFHGGANNDHSSMTEATEVQTLVSRILQGSSTTDIAYVSDTEPSFTEEYDIHAIHSPAHIYATDADGRVSGKTSEAGEWQTGIPGSSYLEIAGGKYLIVPGSIDYEVTIEGEDEGVYTLTIHSLVGNSDKPQHELHATVTPQMVATYEKSDGEFSTIVADFDGDGDKDAELTVDGEVLYGEHTYADLRAAVGALELYGGHQTHLDRLVDQAERLRDKRVQNSQMARPERKLLGIIDRDVAKYVNNGPVSPEEYERIKDTIDTLLKYSNG